MPMDDIQPSSHNQRVAENRRTFGYATDGLGANGTRISRRRTATNCPTSPRSARAAVGLHAHVGQRRTRRTGLPRPRADHGHPPRHGGLPPRISQRWDARPPTVARTWAHGTPPAARPPPTLTRDATGTAARGARTMADLPPPGIHRRPARRADWPPPIARTWAHGATPAARHPPTPTPDATGTAARRARTRAAPPRTGTHRHPARRTDWGTVPASRITRGPNEQALRRGRPHIPHPKSARFRPSLPTRCWATGRGTSHYSY